jgi:hypothetical protein
MRWCRSSNAAAAPAGSGTPSAPTACAAERVWAGVAAHGVRAFVPPLRTVLPAGEPKNSAQREAQAARDRCKMN